MNAQIEGRVAVVTGGSSGIGFETLRLLLGEGRKSPLRPQSGPAGQRPRGAAKRISRRGRVFWRCDVLNEQEVRAFANAVEAHLAAPTC